MLQEPAKKELLAWQNAGCPDDLKPPRQAFCILITPVTGKSGSFVLICSIPLHLLFIVYIMFIPESQTTGSSPCCSVTVNSPRHAAVVAVLSQGTLPSQPKWLTS